MANNKASYSIVNTKVFFRLILMCQNIKNENIKIPTICLITKCSDSPYATRHILPSNNVYCITLIQPLYLTFPKVSKKFLQHIISININNTKGQEDHFLHKSFFCLPQNNFTLSVKANCLKHAFI